jgi:hypothetical protein
MTIQFQHKDRNITGMVVYSDSVNDAMVVFPDSNLGELGWSHFFQKKESRWISYTFLRDKYPDTYLNLEQQINSINIINHFTHSS